MRVKVKMIERFGSNMFKKYKIKRAFNYWQKSGCVHPLTCLHGCGNLSFDYVDKDDNLHIICDHCGYKQKYDYTVLILHQYYLDSKLIVKPFFRWYDMWIGCYVDTENKYLELTYAAYNKEWTCTKKNKNKSFDQTIFNNFCREFENRCETWKTK
jgi:hypothetical protein